MRVYGITPTNYGYTAKSVSVKREHAFAPKNENTDNNVNFKGFHFNYNGILIKYIKMRALRTSVYGSKRPYLSINKNLKDSVNPVKIRVNHFEEINAWDINPKNSDKYVIFLHGFSQNITNNQPLYEALTKTDYGVLAIDYRGYGKNKKTINIGENNMREDVEAAKKYLRAKGINNIGLIGHSFGSYIATKASQRNFFNFQILVSPMLSMQFWLENVLKHPKKYKNENLMIKYIPNFKDQYRKVFRLHRHIAHNSTPTYVIHTKTDRYMKYKDVEDYASRLNKFKEFIMLDKGGHKMDEYKINAIIETVNKLS